MVETQCNLVLDATREQTQVFEDFKEKGGDFRALEEVRTRDLTL